MFSLYTLNNKEPRIIPVVFPDAKPHLHAGIFPTMTATFNALFIDDVSNVEKNYWCDLNIRRRKI
jgi:hypothetical protein